MVVDTNIFVSAFLSCKSDSALVLKAWQERRFILLISLTIISEVAETLAQFIDSAPYAVSQQDVGDVVLC